MQERGEISWREFYFLTALSTKARIAVALRNRTDGGVKISNSGGLCFAFLAGAVIALSRAGGTDSRFCWPRNLCSAADILVDSSDSALGVGTGTSALLIFVS
jgi:hypothetical protein